MFIEALIIIGFAITLYASYTDWKTTEVPDWLTYGGIVIGLGTRTFYSYVQANAEYLIAGLIGFVLLAVAGCVLYYSAQWGGGDAKLLMALGALLGWQPNMQTIIVQDLSTFLMNLMIVGGIYGLAFTVVLALSNKKTTLKQIRQLRKTSLAQKAQTTSHLFCLALLIAAFFLDSVLKTSAIAVGVMLIISYYLWVLTKSVEDGVLVRAVPPEKLTEGDWVLDTIKDKGSIVCSKKDPGISVRQIQKLIDLKQKGRLKTVTMKAGIPFIPAFSIAYIATFTFGNLFGLLRYAF